MSMFIDDDFCEIYGGRVSDDETERDERLDLFVIFENQRKGGVR